MDKAKRIEYFIVSLSEFSPANSKEQAFLLIHYLMNKIEDEYSGENYNPNFMKNDEKRMYAPLSDSRQSTNLANINRYRTFRNYVMISDDGAITILDFNGKVILSKAGLNGKVIEL